MRLRGRCRDECLRLLNLLNNFPPPPSHSECNRELEGRPFREPPVRFVCLGVDYPSPGPSTRRSQSRLQAKSEAAELNRIESLPVAVE